jgi:hypothetical protein
VPGFFGLFRLRELRDEKLQKTSGTLNVAKLGVTATLPQECGRSERRLQRRARERAIEGLNGFLIMALSILTFTQPVVGLHGKR